MPEFQIDAPTWNSIFWFVGHLIIGLGALLLLHRAQHLMLSLHATAIVRGMIHNEFNKMILDARKSKLIKELENFVLPEDKNTE